MLPARVLRRSWLLTGKNARPIAERLFFPRWQKDTKANFLSWKFDVKTFSSTISSWLTLHSTVLTMMNNLSLETIVDRFCNVANNSFKRRMTLGPFLRARLFSIQNMIWVTFVYFIFYYQRALQMANLRTNWAQLRATTNRVSLLFHSENWKTLFPNTIVSLACSSLKLDIENDINFIAIAASRSWRMSKHELASVSLVHKFSLEIFHLVCFFSTLLPSWMIGDSSSFTRRVV